MPSRNQSMIRRDINRLQDTIERHQETYPALAAILPMVASAAELVNTSWQDYQTSAVTGDKERQERDDAINTLIAWIQRWRPVFLMLVPGAATNLRQLPSSGATPDDLIRVAEDMSEFINTNPGAEGFRAAAIADLGEKIAAARKETAEATAAFPAEAAARQAYSEACASANAILIRGTEVIRAIFGPTSPEYKQFIARVSAAEEETADEESLTGEQ